MSYLYCCEQHNIEVVSYSDQAEAILEVHPDGSGQITQAILRPKVLIANASQKQLALDLHQKANQLCFIANSCNFEVVHQATCEVL